MLKMIDFKGIHEGEAGWIVGNGPSLNEMDLTFLNDKVNFCMNRIYLGVEEMGFTPKYYTVEDVFVAEDTPDEINALKYGKFLPKDLDYCLKEDENVCWVDFCEGMMDFRNSLPMPRRSSTGGPLSPIWRCSLPITWGVIPFISLVWISITSCRTMRTALTLPPARRIRTIFTLIISVPASVGTIPDLIWSKRRTSNPAASLRAMVAAFTMPVSAEN